MARVTVEDCIEKIPNRFDLVLTASQRARSIQKGELLTIDEGIIKNMQRLNQNEEAERSVDEAAEMAKIDLDEMVGAASDEAYGDAGMQVGSYDDAPAEEVSGFEDVDLVTLEGDD